VHKNQSAGLQIFLNVRRNKVKNMGIKYTITTEEEASLFDRRVKLAELIILTITALMIIMSFTEDMSFVWPITVFSANLVLIIIIIILGANKTRKETDFGDNDVEATKKEISYMLYWQDILTYIIYGLGIIYTAYIIIS